MLSTVFLRGFFTSNIKEKSVSNIKALELAEFPIAELFCPQAANFSFGLELFQKRMNLVSCKRRKNFLKLFDDAFPVVSEVLKNELLVCFSIQTSRPGVSRALIGELVELLGKHVAST